uniref:Uncharacterized protein n=1 Tax=Rhizophora mucronata TaxID=61149 RepID=A0A2P2N3B0_RHIMU
MYFFQRIFYWIVLTVVFISKEEKMFNTVTPFVFGVDVFFWIEGKL